MTGMTATRAKCHGGLAPAERKSGVAPDPYRIWMSEIMLQQTTVAAVKDYFLKFTSTWPTVSDLAAAKDEDVMAAWAGLGYYARARNLLKCARAVAADFDGMFPDTEEELLKLPGIGPYTAAAGRPRLPLTALQPWWMETSNALWRGSMIITHHCQQPSLL